MELKRKVLIAALGAAPVLGLGGAAWASTMSSAGAQLAPDPTSTTSNPAVDNGPQGASDGSDSGATAEAPETNNQVPGAPESDDPGGHVDAPGVNVYHQFNGQE